MSATAATTLFRDVTLFHSPQQIGKPSLRDFQQIDQGHGGAGTLNPGHLTHHKLEYIPVDRTALTQQPLVARGDTT